MEFEELLLPAALLLLAVAAAAIILHSTRIYREHERGVRFRLGKLNKVLGPGIAFTLPYIDSAITVDMRSRVLEMDELKAMAKEGAVVFLDVVVRYHISSPELAVTAVANVEASLRTLAETAVRNSVGELSFGQLVGKKEFINARLRESVSNEAGKWGLKVEGVEIMDITPSERTMQQINKKSGKR